ncbi:MAG: hypothetical protein M3422_05640 [Actinomycetota bacterium]|nr:hypothetical protein [Actinomycetota bacterium]
MRTGKIISVLFAATAALGVSACGSDEPKDSAQGQQETAAQDTHEKDAENKAKNADELAKDVEIVTCDAGDAIGVSATVEVTNSLDEPMEYIGTINFLDASGKVLTDGVFNTGTLEPGKTGTEEVPGANVYEKVDEYTCELVEVKIDEPV